MAPSLAECAHKKTTDLSNLGSDIPGIAISNLEVRSIKNAHIFTKPTCPARAQHASTHNTDRNICLRFVISVPVIERYGAVYDQIELLVARHRLGFYWLCQHDRYDSTKRRAGARYHCIRANSARVDHC
jgi:hypothetical protein